MASGQTTNFGLNQWAAEDHVLREEFNADNQRIDIALKSLQNTFQSNHEQITALVQQLNGQLNSLSNQIPRIAVGYYTGSGKYGSDNPNTLTFNFTPQLVIVTTDISATTKLGNLFVRGQEKSAGFGFITSSATAMQHVITWGEQSISWYSTAGLEEQLNHSTRTYRYFAIG